MKVLCSLLFSFFLLFPSSTYAAEVGDCRIATTTRAKKRAKHICFTIAKGKDLLLEIKTLRQVEKKESSLLTKRTSFTKDVEKWLNVQLKQADVTVKAQKVQVSSLRVRLSDMQKANAKLTKQNGELVIQVAQYKGARWKWLIIGVGVGVAITAGVVSGVVIAQASK